jgi:hypothetical protein
MRRLDSQQAQQSACSQQARQAAAYPDRTSHKPQHQPCSQPAQAANETPPCRLEGSVCAQSQPHRRPGAGTLARWHAYDYGMLCLKPRRALTSD